MYKLYNKLETLFPWELSILRKSTIQDKGKFYGCMSYHDGCRSTLSKKVFGEVISQSNIKKLLNGERINLIKGFKSKNKKALMPFYSMM